VEEEVAKRVAARRAAADADAEALYPDPFQVLESQRECVCARERARRLSTPTPFRLLSSLELSDTHSL